MFFSDQQAPRSLPADGPPEDDAGGMFYVDFGPLFGEEIQKILRYRNTGMLCEIVFWQDQYLF